MLVSVEIAPDTLPLTMHCFRDSIKEMASSDQIVLRDGMHELFRWAHAQNIPVHVFSAGIYDIIHEVFCLHQMEPYQVHVVSNIMKFERDAFVGFTGRHIAAMGKNYTMLEGSPGYDKLTDRNHVILFGDSTADVTMSEGLAPKVQLNIGFLNAKVESNLPKYEKLFDIVVIGDESASEVVNFLVKALKL